MADITKCANGDKCPQKNTCYRYLASSSNWQSYSDFFDGSLIYCKHYYPMEDIRGDYD